MKITVNGAVRDVPNDSVLLGLLNELQINPEASVVEHNGTIIDQSRYASLVLTDDDVIEIVRFVGGG